MVHLLGEETCDAFVSFFPDLYVVEAFDGEFGRDMAVDEAGAGIEVIEDEFEAEAVAVLEIYDGLSLEAFDGGFEIDAKALEACGPEIEGGAGNRETGGIEHAFTVSTADEALVGEEGEDTAGIAVLVAVVEVVYFGGVEIDSLFDETHAEDACIEIDIVLSVAADGGNVMDAGNELRHRAQISYFYKKKTWVSLINYSR